MKDYTIAHLITVRSKPHSEALCGDDIAKGDKIVLVTSPTDTNNRVALTRSTIESAGDIPYILIEKNDERAVTIYGTAVPGDQQIVLTYDQIGLPPTRDDKWHGRDFVLRLAIAKNVLGIQDELRMLTSGRKDSINDSKVAARA